MTFRSRLTAFFLLIVVVPMVFIGGLLYLLIDESERGRTQAALEAGRDVAARLYEQYAGDAARTAERLAQEDALVEALRAGGDQRADAVEGLLTGRVQRIVARRPGAPVIDVGARAAVAPARRRLADPDGSALGEIEVSVLSGREYAGLVRRITGFETAVRHAAGPASTTLPGLPELPPAGDGEIGEREYRTASFSAPDFTGERLQVLLAVRNDERNERREERVLLFAVVLAAFLALAAAFAVGVSRSLRSEVARFLTAARRIGEGDLSTTIETSGGDEFAALGGEFNAMAERLSGQIDELDQERERLRRAIRLIGEAFASNLDREGLLEIVVQTAVEGTGSAGGRALAGPGPGGELPERAAAGEISGLRGVLARAEHRALASGRTERAAADGHHALAHPLTASVPRADGDEADGARPGLEEADGEGAAGTVRGLIAVARPGGAYTPAEEDLLRDLAARAAVSLENVDIHETVRRQAVTDELTGLANHRRFQEVLEREVERARRYPRPLSLVLVDLDDFKYVNDTWGHLRGDRVLRAVARALRGSVRDIDEPARYGGEEMAVVLPETDLAGARRLAERVRRAIAEVAVPVPGSDAPLRVTASVGVSEMSGSVQDKDSLVAAADAALYRAKAAGKNTVVAAGYD